MSGTTGAVRQPETEGGMHGPTWPEASGFVQSLAELPRASQWPIVALVIVRAFRGETRKLLGRVRRGSLFGAEVELDEAIEELAEGAEAAKARGEAAAQGAASSPDENDRTDADETAQIEEVGRARIDAALSQERKIFSTAAI